MGLKKKVSGQWVDDSGIDFQVDNSSILNSGIANIATTGSYDGDSTSANYNPVATKEYVDQVVEDLPEPMVWTGVISITADSTDTAKCAISVSAPASATNIKKGFTYKVSFIAASPAYTGTIKIGDTLIAAKDAPKVDKTWIEDADWNVVPSGDETGFLIGVASGTSENQLVSFGVNGYTAKNSGVSVKASATAMSGSSDTEVPTSKNIAANVAKTATISSSYAPAQAQAAIAAGDTIEQALGKLEKEADDNKNNISWNAKSGVSNVLPLNTVYKRGVHADVTAPSKIHFYGTPDSGGTLPGLTKRMALKEGTYTITVITDFDTSLNADIYVYDMTSSDTIITVDTSGTYEFTANPAHEYYYAFYFNQGVTVDFNYQVTMRPKNSPDIGFQPYALSNAELTAKEQQNENNISLLQERVGYAISELEGVL